MRITFPEEDNVRTTWKILRNTVCGVIAGIAVAVATRHSMLGFDAAAFTAGGMTLGGILWRRHRARMNRSPCSRCVGLNRE
jgi:hypothetical protein